MTQTKSELILALEQIEREKGVKADDIKRMIEGAIESALRKHMGKTADIKCEIDPYSAQIRAFITKTAMETVTNPEAEMTMAEAKRKKSDVQAGEAVRMEIDTEEFAREFARIAAQTAKQVLTQKIRETERDNLYEEYKPREGELISGSVHRFLERSIIVDLGKTEGILPPREQIRRERYNVGDRVRAVILKVDKAQRGPQVLLSRATPLFLRRLLEMEVPEIGEKIVEVIEIVRDPGFRAKVVVRSNNPKVDPVGACVGLRGSRIRAIMNEAAGERIDLIPYSDDPAAFIGNTLQPAKVASVRILDKDAKRAEVIVPDEQLSLAIGKEGQNIRLASKLSGWTLEVKSQGQRESESKAAQDHLLAGLTELEGVGEKVAIVLVKAGLADIYRLATFKVEDLTTLQGVGEKTAAKIIASAKKYVDEHPRADSAAPAEEAAEAAPAAAADAPAAEETKESQG